MNKFYVRCFICGDSIKDPDKAHLAIFPGGSFKCFRCGAHGELSFHDYLYYAGLSGSKPVKVSTMPEGPAADWERLPVNAIGPLGRKSTVENRWRASTPNGPIEIFGSTTLKGEIVGYQIRASWQKMIRSYGKRWYGGSAEALTSQQIRVVEGPYDAIYPGDICTYGIPSYPQVKALSWRRIILCPDGDVYHDPVKIVAWFGPFVKLNCQVEYLEFITADPDEVPAEERTRIEWAEAIQLYNKAKHQLARSKFWPV